MFRLLEVFVIIGLIILAIYSIVMSVYKATSKSEPKKEASIDEIIQDLKAKIEAKQKESNLGIAKAQQDLEDYKKQLETVLKLKEKIK